MGATPSAFWGIRVVGPCLHHLPHLIKPLRTVVRSARLVSLRKRQLDKITVPDPLIEGMTNRPALARGWIARSISTARGARGTMCTSSYCWNPQLGAAEIKLRLVSSTDSTRRERASTHGASTAAR